jgi:hypothetical protein
MSSSARSENFAPASKTLKHALPPFLAELSHATAGMLAPALTAEQQEEGRLWAAQDEADDYEDAMFDDHGGDYGRGGDY